jgi:hypothetical protein
MTSGSELEILRRRPTSSAPSAAMAARKHGWRLVHGSRDCPAAAPPEWGIAPQGRWCQASPGGSEPLRRPRQQTTVETGFEPACPDSLPDVPTAAKRAGPLAVDIPLRSVPREHVSYDPDRRIKQSRSGSSGHLQGVVSARDEVVQLGAPTLSPAIKETGTLRLKTGRCHRRR